MTVSIDPNSDDIFDMGIPKRVPCVTMTTGALEYYKKANEDSLKLPDVELIGRVEGSVCNRVGCDGVIEFTVPENCSCHINPPCSACEDVFSFCPKCDWEDIE